MESPTKLPEELLALLTDMAQIRREILENAPQCLPALAPAFTDAETRIHAIWGR